MFQSAFQSTLPARGATHCSLREHCSNSAFQSTLPARGATAERWPLLSELQYFNPRSPHGERRSTTAGATCRTYFNPRSPHGERPVYFQCAWRNDGISIHAPRTGSDGVIGVPCAAAVISIHAPRTGSDDLLVNGLWHDQIFQSTLPARGATTAPNQVQSFREFQSTLPARGATA